jgi:DNA repair protein RecO (recombination protein O)
MLYRDDGVVLRTYRLGEADRIVVLCTKRHGKVRAVAKGVRKTKSKFGSRLEPTSHVALQLYEGRELDIVTQVDSIDHFRTIREDLDRLTQASEMLEVVDQMLQEGGVNPRLYDMLVGGLRTLDTHRGPLVVPAFFWKLLSLEGYRPLLDECAECGRPDQLVAFDLHAGGALCVDHRRGVALSPEALGLMRQILGGQLGQALNEPESGATREVDHLATRAVEHHLERRLRSAAVLERG